MNRESLLFSSKYKSFLKNKASVEFLEGTTAAGKTTIALFKFVLKVADSEKRLHIIASHDIGVAEKNLINKELGLLDVFGELVEYRGNGSKADKIPHLKLQTNKGEKTIYVLGYGDKAKWQKALGGQYGCVLIDEINVADMDFVRETSMRCDYLLATLNPDNPNLPIYSEYINHSRPKAEWQEDTPDEILKELCEEENPGWTHWFFSFKDNAGLTKEKLNRILLNTPKGTKIWKNKVEGLRGKATGLVFSNFKREKNVITRQWLEGQLRVKNLVFRKFTAGLDTSYSSKSPDTIAMEFSGITECGKLIILAEVIYNNADRQQPIAPSDIAVKFVRFLDNCQNQWGLARNVFVDSADQATLTEISKYKLQNGCIYTFNPSHKIPIIDRINLQLGWIATGHYLVLDECADHISELESYAWDAKKDDVPEDKNDHTINAEQYGWIPYRGIIGKMRK